MDNLAPLANTSDAVSFCNKLEELTEGIVKNSSTVTGIGNADASTSAVDSTKHTKTTQAGRCKKKVKAQMPNLKKWQS